MSTRLVTMSAKKILLIVAVLLLVAAAVHYFCGGGAGTNADMCNDTDRALERVEEQQQRISDEIAGGRAAITDAQHAANGIADAVSRSESASAEIAGSLDAIRGKIEECRELAERNAELIDGLGKEN